MFDYCNQLEADYVVAVNGYELFCYKCNYEKEQYDELLKLPPYFEMLDVKCEIIKTPKKPKRIGFENYEKFLIECDGSTEFISFGITISARTEKIDIVKTCICVAHDDEKEMYHAS